MTRNTNTTTFDESTDDGKLSRFERNRYFHGKLMTARDMATEQRYHGHRHTAHAQHVSGEGVACGLGVTVTDHEDDDGLTVALTPGYALDSAGRPVVVPNETTTEFDPDEVPDADTISVTLHYSECVRESVPIPGSESACEDECAFNRVLEIFDVRIDGGPPPEALRKGVPAVEFPSKSDLSTGGDGTALDPGDPGLATIARSFAEDDGTAAACETGDGTPVYLGEYEPTDGSTWRRVSGSVPRSRVYTNDMLYAATARHTADFENPHQTSLDLRTAEEGQAALSIEDDESTDADVAVVSSDATIEVSVNVDAGSLDLTAGEGLHALLDEHVAPLIRYVMDKTLKYKYRTFTSIATNFDSATAGQIASETKGAIDDRVYTDRGDYLAFIEQVAKLEAQLVDELEGQVTDESHTRYRDAVESLSSLLKEADEGDVLRVAIAQDEVCEGGEWLEAPDTPEIEIPGDFRLPGGSLLPTSPLLPSLPQLSPGGTGESGSGVLRLDPSVTGGGQFFPPTRPTPDSGGDSGDTSGGSGDTDPTSGPGTGTGTDSPTTVGSGADQPVTLPDLSGTTKEQAEQLLKNAGVQPQTERVSVENSRELEGVGVNEVASQSPAPGETVQPGDTVTLNVQDPPSVTRIEGIGDASADKLASAGIETVGEFATAETGTVQDALGASAERASTLQSQAQRYAESYELTKVPGVGTDEAEALADTANVTSVSDLQNTTTEQLEASTQAAAGSGSVSESTADTVRNLDLSQLKTSAQNLSV